MDCVTHSTFYSPSLVAHLWKIYVESALVETCVKESNAYLLPFFACSIMSFYDFATFY